MIDFLGIGSQKAATTWIYTNLSRHPQIAFPTGKECHFWDCENSDRKTAENWLNLFPINDSVRQGELTPAYACLDRSLIQQIYAVCPDLRIFYSLRNPIDRAWSSALMALRRAEMLLDEASDQWFIDHFESTGSLQRGNYAACLENWRSVFPQAQIQLIFFEDIVLHPRRVLKQLAEHIGVNSTFFEHLSDTDLKQPVNSGSNATIRPTLLPILHQLYDEKIDRLQDLIDRDVNHWKNLSGSASALILAGMHRSGTSLTASLLQQMGVQLGDHLLEGDHTNVKGFFEDVDFLNFQENLLLENLPKNQPGWAGWGWLESQEFDSSQLHSYIAPAKALLAEKLARKQGSAGVWGWKDPRTTLLLDFWHQLLPEASYLLIYRFPWDVADSINRLQASPFCKYPDYAAKIWQVYNQRLLQFYLQHPQQCILASVNMILQQPDRLLHLFQEKLHLPLTGSTLATAESSLATVYEPALFHALNWENEQVHQFQQMHPECIELLTILDYLADIPSSFTSSLKLNPTSDCHPLVSIIIPCFNQGEFLLEALASIAACSEIQSGLSHELIVVNDGSTETISQKILEGLSNRGYTVIHQENRGLSAARNTAISRAMGKYILPLDADNKIRSGYLSKSIDILERYSDVGIVYADVSIFGEEVGIRQVPDFDLYQLLRFNYIDACAVFRKTVWQDCSGYDSMPNQLGYEDWELWLHAAKRGWHFYHIPEVLFDYRVRSNSMSENCGKPEHQQLLYAYVCQKHCELYSQYFPELFAEQQFNLRQEYFNGQKATAMLLEVQSKFESCQHEIDHLHQQIDCLQMIEPRLEQAQQALQQSQTRSQQLESELLQTQTELSHTQLELLQTQTVLEEMYSCLKEMEPILEQVDLQRQEVQQSLKKSQSTMQQQEQEIAQLKLQFQVQETELLHLQAQSQQSQQEQEKQQQQLCQSQTEYREVEIERQQWQTRSQQLEAELKQARREIKHLEIKQLQLQWALEQQPTLNRQVEYELFVWDAWNAYQQGEIHETVTLLQRSLTCSDLSRTENILQWQNLFTQFALEQQKDYDFDQLAASEQWQSLVQQMFLAKVLHDNY